nr:dsbD [Erythrotrichia longistipitata]
MYNLIDNYIFLFKEYCNYILTINTVYISYNTFIGIFFFGWLTSLNPCSISIIPMYLSYVGSETKTSANNNSFFFILGFFINFIVLSLLLTYSGKIYRQLFSNSDLTSGLLLMFVGVTLLKILPAVSISNKKAMKLDIKFSGSINAIAVGFSSAFITSACNIPIVIVLLTWLSSLNNPLQSLLLSITYVSGYSLSIFLASLASNFLSQIRIINQIISWITSLLGSIILSSGVFSICHFFRL